MVGSKDLALQKMPGPVDEPSHPREELSQLKGDKDRSASMNKVVLALETKIFGLKKMASSHAGSLHEVKARAV